MKKMGLAFMMSVLALSTTFAYAADGVVWLALSEGAARAKVEKKPMLVDFYYGAGCPRCEKLVKDGYGDQALAQRIMVDFIPIRVDLSKKLTEEEETLGDKFDYKKECLLLFLDSEGNIINDPDGKPLSSAADIEPEKLIHYLDVVRASRASKDKQ